VNVVLDSWAVLRYLENTDPAASLVAELLEDRRPLMSWINLGEVYYVVRRMFGESEAMETVRDLRARVEAVLPDESLVLAAARIKADVAMSYADAFAASLAQTRAATLWTGDPELLVEGSAWQWRDLRGR